MVSASVPASDVTYSNRSTNVAINHRNSRLMSKGVLGVIFCENTMITSKRHKTACPTPSVQIQKMAKGFDGSIVGS